jgi:hypothetical protein
MRGVRPRAGKRNTPTEQVDDRSRPKVAFVRPGKRWSQILADIKGGEYTWAQFVEGLDEEELARGQLRADNGTFVGRPPSMVPREFHLACQREMKRRFDELFQSDVIPIAKAYLAMAQSKDLKPETKAKMLQYAMERVFGPVPKELKVTQEAPWEQMVVNVMRTPDEGLPEHLQERYLRYQERQSGAED